ncbi:MAG: hypothetical protein KAT91_00720 [Candidatus Aenigmarchaeota archaeon]|nr:hypothetical protein [Candidatus Aenigmarchaeota archaeon]
MAKAVKKKTIVKKTETIKKVSKQAKKAVKQTNQPVKSKSPAVNNFLFGHDKMTKTDIIEIIMFVSMFAFMLFVYLKVQEVI